MNSFTFGLWTGFVAGFVFTALLKQSSREPSMEEKLLGPHAAQSLERPSDSAISATAPANLADALAQQDQQHS